MDKFWSKVSINLFGCWEWTGSRIPYGYGQFRPKGKNNILAHRLSWVLTYRPIPEGMQVLHECDNPPCVRPSHLFLGTQKDNVQDCKDKGRLFIARGQNNGRSKLTRLQVKTIRLIKRKRGDGLKLARRYKVSLATVNKILSNETWRHL